MPLRIKVPAGERIVVNGAVIESGSESTSLIFHNRVDILRRKEIMSEEEASTPARRMYYSIQCAYLFKADRDKFIGNYTILRDQYLEAAPSASEIVAEVDARIADESYYEAIRSMQKVIEHEDERLALFQAKKQGGASLSGSS